MPISGISSFEQAQRRLLAEQAAFARSRGDPTLADVERRMQQAEARSQAARAGRAGELAAIRQQVRGFEQGQTVEEFYGAQQAEQAAEPTVWDQMQGDLTAQQAAGIERMQPENVQELQNISQRQYLELSEPEQAAIPRAIEVQLRNLTSPSQEMPRTGSAPPGSPQYEGMFFDFMKWGYSGSELRGILATAGMEQAPVSEAAPFLRNYMEQQYGRQPPTMGQPISAGGPTLTPLQLRNQMAGWRARQFGAATPQQMPRPEDWPAGRIGRQGSQKLYHVPTFMEAGIMVPVPGQAGQFWTGAAEGKLPKRAQLWGVHETAEVYAPTGKSMMQRALMPTGGGPQVAETGVSLRWAVPLVDVFPSGQGLLKPGVFGAVARRQLITQQLPEGFQPELPAVGTTWDVSRGRGVTPYPGAAPVQIGGGYRQARLLEAQVQGDVMQMLLEKSISPEQAMMVSKTGGMKITLPVARSQETFEQILGGRTDIEAIGALKDPLGLAWQYYMQQTPAELETLLGRKVDPGETWQSLASEYLPAFREKVLPQKIEEISYTLRVHEAQVQAGYLRQLEQRQLVAGVQPVAGTGGVDVTTQPIPTFVGELFTMPERQYPGRRPFLPYRELQRLEAMAPREYARVMRESAPAREAFTGMAQAQLATMGGAAPGTAETALAGAVTPTSAQAAELVGRARAAAAQGLELQPGAQPPPEAMTYHILQQARQAWGTRAVGVGEGRYLAAPEYVSRFGAAGIMKEQEVAGLTRAWAGGIQGIAAGEEGGEQVSRALRAQAQFVGAEKGPTGKYAGGFFRGMLGASLGPRAGEGMYQASWALGPAEAVMPIERVLRGYGLRPGSVEAGEFLAKWGAGEIKPRVLAPPQPTRGDEPYQMGISLLHPLQAAERGVELARGTPLVMSPEAVQAFGKDVDADRILNLFLGEVQFSNYRGQRHVRGMAPGDVPTATPENIYRMAREEEVYGTKLRGELGGGLGTLGALQQALTPGAEGGLRQVGAGQFQQEYREQAQIQQAIGGTFNLFENLTGAARRAGVGQAGVEAADRLFRVAYGIAQRPARLPPAMQALQDIFQTYNISTGGYFSSAMGRGYGLGGGPGLRSMMRGIVRPMAELLRPGSLDPESGAAVLTPTQFAAAMGHSPDRVSELKPLAEQYARGTPEEQVAAIGRLESMFAGNEITPQEVLGTTIGALLGPTGYGRAQAVAGRAAAGQEVFPSQQRGIGWLQRLQAAPVTRGLAQQLGGLQAQISGWRAAVGKNVPFAERVAGLFQHAPGRAYQLLGGMVPTEEQAAEAVPAVAAVPPETPAAAAAPAAETAVTGRLTQEEADALDTPQWWAAQRAGRIAPSTPSAVAAGIAGTGGGGVGGVGGAAAAAGDVGGRGQAALVEMLNRMTGISPRQFQQAVGALQTLLPKWGETVQGLIDSGQKLTSGQRAVVTQMDRWRRQAQQGAYQYAQDPRLAPEVRLAQQWMGGGAGAPFAQVGAAAAQAAQQRVAGVMGQAGGQWGWGGGGGGGAWGGLGRGVAGAAGAMGLPAGGPAGVAQRALSGWGLMWARRVWGMFGAPAFRGQQVAAGEEMAVQRAMQAWQPGAQMGPVAQGVLGIGAMQRAGQARMGRGAWMAYGPVQQALAGGAGEAAGVFGPALAAGMIAGRFLGPSVGTAVGLGTGAFGMVNLAQARFRDPTERAIEAARFTPEAMGGQRGVPFLQRLWSGAQLGLGALLNPEEANRIQRERAGRDEIALGTQILGGEVGQLQGQPAAQAAALREWAGQQGGIMDPSQWAQMAGEYQAYAGDVERLGDIPTERLSQMYVRGLTPGALAGMGARWGLTPRQGFQQMGQLIMGGGGREGMTTGQQVGFQFNEQFLAPLARFGLTPQMAAGMGAIGGAQNQRLLQGLAGGNQFAWSRMGQQFGLENLQTVSPQTGFGIGRNWGGDILQGNLGQTGAAGRAVDVQGGNITFNVTGQTVAFTQWDIQDYGIAQRRGFEDQQAAFQRGGWEQAGQYVLGGGDFGRGTRAIGAEMRGVQYQYQLEQFGFQRRNLALANQQFMERWGRGQERQGVTEGWWQEDWQERGRRQGVVFGWGQEDIEFRGQQAGLRFGWQMEDLEEAERFATGRGRRRIRTQRERAAITYGMGMGRLEEEESRLTERREWQEEDHAKEKDRHETRSDWQRDELELQLTHHRQRMDLSQDRLNASEDHYETMHGLQEEQTELAETYWEAQHERQGEALTMAEDYRDIQREIETAQIALGRAQEVQVNRFRAEFEASSLLDQAWRDFWDRAIAWLEEREEDLFVLAQTPTAGGRGTFVP